VIEQQRGVSHGTNDFNNLSFTDDLTIVAEIRRLGVPSGGVQLLLNAIEEFSNWSVMEVKIVKSCGMWVGSAWDLQLPLVLSFREGNPVINWSYIYTFFNFQKTGSTGPVVNARA
jgi:hypothetical protein